MTSNAEVGTLDTSSTLLIQPPGTSRHHDPTSNAQTMEDEDPPMKILVEDGDYRELTKVENVV